jgi:23S rRNA pseudouridine1911/1915/1917 synthase
MIKPTKDEKELTNYNANTALQESDELNEVMLNVTIPNNYAGLRLDQALAQLFPNWSRSRLQLWISQKRITLDGKAVNSKQKVWGNEQICINPKSFSTGPQFKAEAIRLNIIYEDDFLLIINKPVGMVVHPGNGNWQGTMLNALLHHAAQLSNVPRAGIVHRLDKDTSGLLVVAKTIDTQINLIRQLQQHQVKRNYLALVLGQVTQNGQVDEPIGRHPVQRTKMAVIKKGKPARTHYQILEQFDGCTLLQCSLETGRTHQIRVHMHKIGHPLAGDPIYGGKPKKTNQEIGQLLTIFPRQALHAQQLELAHPKNDKIMRWEATLPDDMNTLLQTLRQYC